MAISVVQSNSVIDTAGSTGSLTKAYTSNNTAGSASVAILVGSDSTSTLWNTEFSDVTDSRNTYVKVLDHFNNVYGLGIKIFVAYNIGAGANTVTVATDTNNPSALYIYEIAGVATTNAFDQVRFGAYFSAITAFDSKTTLKATTNANEILIGAFVAGLNGAQTWTVGASYTNLLQNTNSSALTSATETQIVSATGSYNATATVSLSSGGIGAIISLSDTAITQVAKVYHVGTTFNTTTGTHTLAGGVLSGDLITITRASTGITASVQPTDNNADGLGGVGGYTLVTSALKNTSADLMEVWVRNAAIGTSSSTTFTEVGGVSTGGGLSVYRITNMSKFGSSAIKQSTTQANQTTATPAPTFGASVLTANPVLSAVFNAGSVTGNLTAKANYQGDIFWNYSTPTTALNAMYTQSGETGTAITWGSSSSTAFCSMAIEFDTSAAATGPTPANDPAMYIQRPSFSPYGIKPIITDY